MLGTVHNYEYHSLFIITYNYLYVYKYYKCLCYSKDHYVLYIIYTEGDTLSWGLVTSGIIINFHRYNFRVLMIFNYFAIKILHSLKMNRQQLTMWWV